MGIGSLIRSCGLGRWCHSRVPCRARRFGAAGAVFGAALCRRFCAASFSALAVDEGAIVDVFYGGSLLLP